ncbi:COMM domain-containing protein 4 isoform X2 [Stomoxys calcitrans]|uniref:COMM domain-containing protein 4 isoform X2 n=1 Tax=Stomoxys calcitrans TaxID=35570 RepID=UPI0027E22323|nr:COMM domain-containing protein 4 isoform X2 [Stomoxys calcitrans]
MPPTTSELQRLMRKAKQSGNEKFRFCGDGDCPDWVLGEIISTLSVLEANQLKTLADMVARKILGQQFDDEVKSLTSTVSSDGKTAIASIHFLLNNAARHNASELVFNEEIQQLGLPKEHAAAMCTVLTEHAKAIRQRLIDKSFKINELESIRFLPPTSESINCSRFELKIAQDLVNGLPQDTTHVLHIDNAQLRVLLNEMKHARSIMDKYDNTNFKKI